VSKWLAAAAGWDHLAGVRGNGRAMVNSWLLAAGAARATRVAMPKSCTQPGMVIARRLDLAE
jgi:hypothetical protein